METLYKVLGSNGKPYHGGAGTWSLPSSDGPGDWMPPMEVIPCRSGYHLCRGAKHLIHWLGPEIYAAESRGEVVEAENKVVAAEARLICRIETWNERVARLFAADCAEHVLHIFEAVYPNDKRPREAIEAARKYARGEISAEELRVYANAVYDARQTYYTTNYASYAAADAAYYATTNAAGVTYFAAYYARAFSVSSRAVERQWQVEKLRQYLSGKIQ